MPQISNGHHSNGHGQTNGNNDTSSDGGGLVYVANYIHGGFEPANSYLDSVNPATGRVWARIPDSSSETVDRAVYSAGSAFPQWAELSMAKRAQYLLKVSV